MRDSDATLILNRRRLSGGTLQTLEFALEHGKPAFVAQLGGRIDTARFRAWLRRHRVRVLNVAGPRESKRPGIYRQSRMVLRELLRS